MKLFMGKIALGIASKLAGLRWNACMDQIEFIYKAYRRNGISHESAKAETLFYTEKWYIQKLNDRWSGAK